MKNTRGFVSKRQQSILKYLKEHKRVQTNDLAQLLNTSKITIRRDFQVLENEGIIKRCYGGATLVEGALNEDPYFNELDDKKHLLKEQIAKEAAKFIEDGDIIFINSSSTAIKVLEYIGDKRVIVITNNGKVLNMNISPKIELVLTGGEVYGRKQSMVGDIATQIISKITADKCFLGVSGITADSGISTSVLQETSINIKMLENCNGSTFILADSSKIGHRHNFSSGNINKINTIITDSNISEDKVQDFKNKGIDVILCE